MLQLDEILDIFDEKIFEIAELAHDNFIYQFADGVVQINYETGELFGASFTTGTLENPENPFIELYRDKMNIEYVHECDGCTVDKDIKRDCEIESIVVHIQDNWDYYTSLISEQYGEVA